MSDCFPMIPGIVTEFGSACTNQKHLNTSKMETAMKQVLKLAAVLVLGFPALAGSATLTTDPLTKLPLIPSTDPGFHLDNAPMRLPDTQMCKSKMQTDFYSLDHGKLGAAIAWYGAHLSGFHKTH